MALETKIFVINVLFMFLNFTETTFKYYFDIVRDTLSSFQSSNKQQKEISFEIYQIIIFFLRLPIFIFYYCYLAIPIFVAKRFYKIVIMIFKQLCKRSSNLRRVVLEVNRILLDLEDVRVAFFSLSILDLITMIIKVTKDVFFPNPNNLEKELSIVELSELLSYEEIEEESLLDLKNQQNLHSLHYMHHFIPPNPFRATIRIHRSPAGKPNNPLNNPLEGFSETVASGTEYLEADSPASFPGTPFSRAYVMGRASEKVVSVMFAARDRLRLEAQSISRDEYSRKAAREAKSSGQFAVFDFRQTSSGIALTCGSHCAMKVGRGFCCCCRSMVPVRTATYVYFEFSVTVSSAQKPTLGIGLAPPDCPLNVMVGSWPRSVGLYSDGQILSGSHWFQSISGAKIEAGATVGVLVYIPEKPSAVYGEVPTEVPTLPTSKENPTIKPPSDKNPGDLTDGESEPSGLNSKPTGNQISDFGVINNSISGDEKENTENPRFLFHFNIDGEIVKYPEEAEENVNEIVSYNTPLYPTVSLFSEETRVWCRFCEADIVYRKRENIGAPVNQKVYSLDGSLLLRENE